MAYWEYATPVLGDYHYDTRTQIPHRHEESRAYPEDQKIYDINAWWDSIKFKNDIQIKLEQNGIDWIEALKVKAMSTSHTIENVDIYLRESIDIKLLTALFIIYYILKNLTLGILLLFLFLVRR